MSVVSEFKIGIDGTFSAEYDDGSVSTKKLDKSFTAGDTSTLMKDLSERYQSEQARTLAVGSHFVEPVSSIPSADQPTITGISATPATDLGATPFIVQPWGVDCDSVALNYQMTTTEKINSKKWMRGFSVGA